MLKFKFLFFIMAGFLICVNFSQIYAQDETASDDAAANQKLNNPRRQGVLRDLDLKPVQTRQIRQINQESRDELRAAQTRLRAANKNLDAAIYADNLNAADIQTKTKELQLAQTEMIRLRAMKELAIRKVLDSAQLSKFREARQDFEPQREKQTNERLNRQTNPRNRQFRNRARP
jgi:Spy/CpxP family protein refolding chaperone